MAFPRITAYPIGCADTLRIDMRDGRKVLVDYADKRNPNDSNDKRIDLPAELRNDLRLAKRDFFDVVVFTHLDDDHVCGTSKFFWLDHAAKYQGQDRIKIKELWVPAGVLTEMGCEECARAIRQEARYRMRQGFGIRVFSRPDALNEWFRKENIAPSSRRHLITDAGNLVPGFSKNDSGGVEFFIHAPFGWRRNEREVENRNQDSVVFQATFREGGFDTRAMFTADVDEDGLGLIVDISKRYGNQDRLLWDIMKISHHSSYLSLAKLGNKGMDETVPTPDVKWLFEEGGQAGAILLSSSKPIPEKNTAEDRDVQPPHRQAANYYRRIAKLKNGRFEVTMERTRATPKPTTIEITSRGAAVLSQVSAPAVVVSTTPMRAG